MRKGPQAGSKDLSLGQEILAWRENAKPYWGIGTSKILRIKDKQVFLDYNDREAQHLNTQIKPSVPNAFQNSMFVKRKQYISDRHERSSFDKTVLHITKPITESPDTAEQKK